MMPAQATMTIQERMVASGPATLYTRFVGGYDGGPALVVLHGGPGLSHEYLLPMETLASPTLRVVSYDQRGVGRSTGTPTSSAVMQEYADDLEAVRRAVGAERIHVLAHSGGGFPAIAYAGAHPERVASIIFVDCVPPTATTLSAGLARFGSRVASLQAHGLLPAHLPAATSEDGTASLLAILPAYFVDPLHPGARTLNNARFRPGVYETVLQGLGPYDLREQVAALTMPTLCMTAEVPFGAEFGGEMASTLPADRTRTILWRDAGHLPWVERPQPFFDSVRDFLKPLVEDA